MSVNNRWVGPCEQVLNVPIACRWYRTGKPSSLSSTKGGPTPTSSMTALREKLGTDSQIGQLACCGLCWELFFLGVVTLSVTVDNFMKGCYALTTWDTYHLGPYAVWAWDACDVLVRFHLHGVLWFESPWLSNISNCLFATGNTLLINGMLFINESWVCFAIITCIATSCLV
jgi:hypothetical protein